MIYPRINLTLESYSLLTLVTPNRVQNSKQKWKQTNNEKINKQDR